MKTDLSHLFSKLARFENNQYEPFEGHISMEYPKYQRELRKSNCFKIHCRIRRPEKLAAISRIGLMFADSVIISGYGSSMDYDDFRVALEFPPPVVDSMGPDILFALGYKLHALGYFNDEFLRPWFEEVKPFVEDGRLLYMPTYLEFSQPPKGVSDLKWRLDSRDDSNTFLFDSIVNAKTQGAQSLIDQADKVDASLLEALSCSIPYLENVPFKTLHKVLEQEEDSLVAFRKEMSKVIPMYLTEAKDMESEDSVRKIGLMIRRDVIEPEVAALNKSMRKIVQSNSLKTAGATLGAIGLGVAAYATGGLSALVPVGLGTGGIGALLSTFGGFNDARSAIKDSPWYFAWRLRNSQESDR